jgi:hypothetical protein
MSICTINSRARSPIINVFFIYLLMYLLYTSDGLRLDFICCVGGKKHFKDKTPFDFYTRNQTLNLPGPTKKT